MYNIAITQKGKNAFFADNDGKPRNYPTLADALVSAQYLGLTRQDVELHFVKEGTVIGELSETKEDGPLPGMNKKQLLAYAKKKGIKVNADMSAEEIVAAIQAALPDEEAGKK
jgi:Pyruvate/2-oxoacid:ferredoxin oxidoreductase gamma subunit